MKEIIIIGGGASGLVAAIYAAKSGKKVTILEKNKVCGKKILITGNGKCNYYNQDQRLFHYHSSNQTKINEIINKHNTKEVLNLFDSIGIIPKIKDGYYYPYSNQASSIQTALIKEAELQGVEIITQTNVLEVQKNNNIFKIITDNKEYYCNKVILATGSKAAPKTGSTGIGYEIATSLGHSLVEPLPALVQLKSTSPFLKDWHGIRSDVTISLIKNNNIITKQTGEIQLTNYGISGICVFSLSGQVSQELFNNQKPKVLINFLHSLNIENFQQFIEWMNQRNQKISNRSISDLLDGILNYKLINLILKLSHIKRESSWNEITPSHKELLGNYLTKFSLNITSTNSFEHAQTCTGGIPLTEVNLKNMESLKTKGLYIIGELLDIDGDCGGYNLTNAWITGYLAGKKINDK